MKDGRPQQRLADNSEHKEYVSRLVDGKCQPEEQKLESLRAQMRFSLIFKASVRRSTAAFKGKKKCATLLQEDILRY